MSDIALTFTAKFRNAELEAAFQRNQLEREVVFARRFLLAVGILAILGHLGFLNAAESLPFIVVGCELLVLWVVMRGDAFVRFANKHTTGVALVFAACAYQAALAAATFVSFVISDGALDQVGCQYGGAFFALFYSLCVLGLLAVAPFVSWLVTAPAMTIVMASRDFWHLVNDIPRAPEESYAVNLFSYTLLVVAIAIVRERHMRQRRTFVLLDSLRANDIRVNFQKESLASALRGWLMSGEDDNRVGAAADAEIAVPWKIDAASIDWSASIELGAGSFGRVYRANWHGTVVAIKEVKHISQRTLQSFIDEIALLAELRHPNIVLFMGVAVEEGPRVLMVTEFLNRGSLGDLLYNRESETILSEGLLFNIFAQTCRGLAYLHTRTPPVLHHDIKPENILLDNKGNAKLGDFGVSSTAAQNRGAGTPLYTAPEVLNGEPYTAAADVYALGLVFWESWTRERPFIGMDNLSLSVEAILMGIAQNDLRPPIEPTMPKLLATICTQCWHRTLEKRPSVEELVAAFELDEQAAGRAASEMGSMPSTTTDEPGHRGIVAVVVCQLNDLEFIWSQDSEIAKASTHLFVATARKCIADIPGASEAKCGAVVGQVVAVLRSPAQAQDLLSNLVDALLLEPFEGSGSLAAGLAHGQVSSVPHPGSIYDHPPFSVAAAQIALCGAGQVRGDPTTFAPLVSENGSGWLYGEGEGSLTRLTLEPLAENRFSTWIVHYGELDGLSEVEVGPFAVTLTAQVKGQPTCVKRLHARSMTEFARLEFLSELGRLRKLAHAHIAKVIGGCLPPPHFCVLVEFVGPSLKQELVRLARPLTLSEATRVLRETASGMAYLASVGIVHRELHAGNVLVAGSGLPVGEIKVTDYGFGQLRLQTVTMTRNLSVLWKAPEILQGEAATEKSDVYSFGVLAGEVMGGRWEGVEGAGLARVAQMVIEDGRRPVVPWSDGSAIGALIRHCWSHEPSQRPAFAQVVEHLLGGLNEVTASIEIIPAYPG